MRRGLLTLLVLLIVPVCGCQVGNEIADNPVPEIHAISPSLKVVNMPVFTLEVTGANLVPGTQVLFDSVAKATTWISAGKVTCQIQPDDILDLSGVSTDSVMQEVDQRNIPVMLRNPGPGGGDSQSLDFLLMGYYSFNTPAPLLDKADGRISTSVIDNNGTIHIFFERYGPVMHIGSTDNGQTWTEPVTVFNVDPNVFAFTSDADAVIDENGTLFCVCNASSHQKQSFEMLFSRSTDNGATWSDPVVLPQTGTDMGYPVIRVNSGGTLFIVHYDSCADGKMIAFSRSTDSGSTWTTPMNISGPGISFVSDPAMAVGQDGVIHVAFDGYDNSDGVQSLFYTKSSDDGDTWSDVQIILKGSGSHVPMKASIATGADNAVYIGCIWLMAGNFSLYLHRSPDNGGSWDVPFAVTNGASQLMGPHMAVDTAGNINLLWYYKERETINGFWSDWYRVFFSRSIDGGMTWTPQMAVSEKYADSVDPKIIADIAGNLFIAWNNNSDKGVFTISTRD